VPNEAPSVAESSIQLKDYLLLPEVHHIPILAVELVLENDCY
jgi:hypothetical protein